MSDSTNVSDASFGSPKRGRCAGTTVVTFADTTLLPPGPCTGHWATPNAARALTQTLLFDHIYRFDPHAEATGFCKFIAPHAGVYHFQEAGGHSYATRCEPGEEWICVPAMPPAADENGQSTQLHLGLGVPPSDELVRAAVYGVSDIEPRMADRDRIMCVAYALQSAAEDERADGGDGEEDGGGGEDAPTQFRQLLWAVAHQTDRLLFGEVLESDLRTTPEDVTEALHRALPADVRARTVYPRRQ